jgi:ABC-type uncharacterized transport system auxiliary subunit
MGTVLGITMARAKTREAEKKHAEQDLLIQQQAKQIWVQADRIHNLEIEKLQMSSWRQPEDQMLYERLSTFDEAPKRVAVA